MSTLYLTRGCPGAGKTTWAKQFVEVDPVNRVRVNRDDLRDMMFGRKTNLTYPQEEEVTRAETAIVTEALEADRMVVVDNMHLRPKYVKQWYEVAAKAGAADVVTVDFWEDLDTLKKRNLSRPAKDLVDPDIITTLYTKYTRKGNFLPVPTYKEFLDTTPDSQMVPYERDPNKPYTAVLFDIDGTLAKNTSGRGWYDWSRVGEDEKIEDIVNLAHTMQDIGMDVIYMSGRDSSCRDTTQKWLQSHGLWGELLMRKEGDIRPDDLAKYELFDQHVRDSHNIWFVVDDRPSVCRMWRKLGLTVLQVGDPHFEF